MKNFFLLITLLSITGFTFKEKPEEQGRAEKSVLLWADKTFEHYDSPRFENFNAVPTDAYFKLENKVIALKEYREEMRQSFADGEIKKPKEEFDSSLTKLNHKIDSLDKVRMDHPDKVSYFEIDFWSNIKVSNGLTAYYMHHVRLDPGFAILSAEKTSSVGKVDESIKILYRK